MGQYFTFLNIDKRQQISTSKYGECFPSNTPVKIIQLLAVPESGFREKTPDVIDEYWRSIHPQDFEPVTWAGDRIICIGDYVNDWPDSILAADDCKSLESPRFLYENAPKIRTGYSRPPQYHGHGVLRNLTKKIYVRSEGIESTFFIDGEDDKSSVYTTPGLAHVLMSRIGWSADPSAAMAWEKADTLVEGYWAGDRFDVRSYNDVEAEITSGGWIDATEDEAKRLASIWVADG